MTPHMFNILLFSCLAVSWFFGAWSNLRSKNKTRPGYGMSGHMAILAGFQTAVFTLIIISDPKWLQLTDLGLRLLAVTPIVVIVTIFVIVRLLYGKDPE